MSNHRRRIIRTKVPLAEISGVFAVVRSIDSRAFNEVRRLAENAASEFFGYAGAYTGYGGNGGNTYFVFSDEQALLAFKLQCPHTVGVVNMVPEAAVFTLHTYINN